MLWGVHLGGLELRSEGGETRLRGRFPYGQQTVLREGGDGLPELREVFAPRAFGAAIEHLDRNVHLLAQHDFAKPMASVGNGTLTLSDSEEGLVFEARLRPSLSKAAYAADLIYAIEDGLITGVSPGFRIMPGEGSETIERKGAAILRTIRAARLEEISIVTRPAYPTAQIEARNWSPRGITAPPPAHPSHRWR